MLTPKGEQLYHFYYDHGSGQRTCQTNFEREPTEEKRHIKFEQHLPLVNILCPQIMAKYFTQHPNVQITMPVENTKRLLQRLNNGEI